MQLKYPLSNHETFTTKCFPKFSSFECLNLSHHRRAKYFLLSVTNNSEEYVFSTLSTNDIQSSYIQEITPNLECENALLQRDTGRPENSEVYFAKEHISSYKHIDESSTTGSYDICIENLPDILVNQLHETIVEMKKCEDEGFKKEYSVSRRKFYKVNI